MKMSSEVAKKCLSLLLVIKPKIIFHADNSYSLNATGKRVKLLLF